MNKKVVENYTYEASVVDGANVPPRVYRIQTRVTEHGGTIQAGARAKETAKSTQNTNDITVKDKVEYTPTELDRSVVNQQQIRKVLERSNAHTEHGRLEAEDHDAGYGNAGQRTPGTRKGKSRRIA